MSFIRKISIEGNNNNNRDARDSYGVDHSEDDDDNDDNNDVIGLDESSTGSSCGESELTDNDNNKKKSKGNNTTESNKKKVHEYASKETKRVQLWRFIVVGSILIVGALVATLTYTTLRSENNAQYTQAFTLFANSIEDDVKHHIKEIFDSNRAMSRFITISAITAVRGNTSATSYKSATSLSSNEFPFVWVHNFETHGHEVRKHANIDMIMYAPIVPASSNDNTKIVQEYVRFTNYSRSWLEESKIIYDQLEPGMNRSSEPIRLSVPPVLYNINTDSTLEVVPTPYENDYYNPRLYTSPPPRETSDIIQNEDFYSNQQMKLLSEASSELKEVVFSELSPGIIDAFENELNETVGTDTNVSSLSDMSTDTFDIDYVRTFAIQPVYDRLDTTSNETKVVAYLYSVLTWERFLLGLLPQDITGIYAILHNTCNQSISYELHGEKAIYKGRNDHHDIGYDGLKRSINFTENYKDEVSLDTVDGHCQYFVEVYPNTAFQEKYNSDLPVKLTVVVAILFFIMAGIFFMYDSLVKTRDEKVVGAAARSSAIVASLFPSNVRDRILADQEDNSQQERSVNTLNTPRSLKGYLSEKNDSNHGNNAGGTDVVEADVFKTKPIADLFPETTVMFGDIVGFTAWTSVREPAQVFTLLETLFHAFDEIANRRRVFKVETVGDCYVAVCGLPDPRRDHAVTMARFARDCLNRMWSLTSKLEVSLGPETAELAMRIGLHSGPVTAGVLRGERSRFQLFGDTMNTAARIESNGAKDRIHLSQETAELLLSAGKTTWVTAREDKIIAKGKGELQTYWLTLVDRSETSASQKGGSTNALTDCETASVQDTANFTLDQVKDAVDSKTLRLINWQVEMLSRLLKQIIAKRIYGGLERKGSRDLSFEPAPGQTVLDEVKEIITLPQSRSPPGGYDISTVKIDPVALTQLHEYVTVIASMYRDNPFHNFEHASHVTMSVVKLLSRIIAPSEQDVGEVGENDFSLHDHTYGITSDPLTQFACVFSALVHDLDHSGVPNAQLAKENNELSNMYKNKSIAEQNSVDLAWQVLMSDNYKDLRAKIYINEMEMNRFRQLVVNSVMATDIVDKEMKALRNLRWDTAFSEVHNEESSKDNVNRKATIVIEHSIQASDVAHTMQHWHIYRKWNSHFFMECYKAYKEGRAETDPSVNWYQGEIGFFDFYIIPLAKKLKNCGVFGVSSDEYLNYATRNRHEWEQRGQEVVTEMVEKAKSFYG